MKAILIAISLMFGSGAVVVKADDDWRYHRRHWHEGEHWREGDRDRHWHEGDWDDEHHRRWYGGRWIIVVPY